MHKLIVSIYNLTEYLGECRIPRAQERAASMLAQAGISITPEERHPSLAGSPGKMETLRCRWGQVWLYVAGEPTSPMQGGAPAGSEAFYTVFHETSLHPGEQY